MKAGALGAATLAASRFAFTQTYQGASSPGPQGPVLDLDPAIAASPYALIQRITYGVTPYEIAQFTARGWDKYLAYQMAPATIPDTLVNSLMIEFPSISATPYQALKVYGYSQGFDVLGDLSRSLIIRRTMSYRQLQEVLTEFWLDHFNVFSGAIWTEFLPVYVNTIRANAFAPFEILLGSVVRSAAMLMYLNNVQNDGANHNENFARELLELHTLGAYQGYNEQDIYTTRRCLTGWNFHNYYDWPWVDKADSNFGAFQYYPEHHDNEGGYFMGTIISKGDMEQGTKILSMIANHPNTAKHLATKLITKFVTETPSATFVNAAANVFLANRGSIAAVLKYILGQTVFTANFQPKYKRPVHFMASAMRASNAYIADASDLLYWVLQPMRQMPFQWQPPNGYPDAYLSWSDNLLPRWRFASNLMADDQYGARTDPFQYMTDRSREGVLAYINKYCFSGGLSATRISALSAFMAVNYPSNSVVREAIGLAISLPDFQWY